MFTEISYCFCFASYLAPTHWYFSEENIRKNNLAQSSNCLAGRRGLTRGWVGGGWVRGRKGVDGEGDMEGEMAGHGQDV